MGTRLKSIDAAMIREERRWTQVVRSQVIRDAKGRCACCNFYCPYILEIHHINAIHRGGTSTLDNLVALCPNCHAIAEKMRSSLLDDDRFHDWIRSEVGEEAYERLGALAGFVLAGIPT